MIQNAARDVTEPAHIKQLANLGVANGNKALTYDSYDNLFPLLIPDVSYQENRNEPFMQQTLQAMIRKKQMTLSMMQDMKLIQLT
jgi:hypothetical protein